MFNFSYRQGTSYARGTTIDEYLNEQQVKKLYSKWDESWGEPFKFHGGSSAITCEMVLEAPEQEFLKAMGKKIGNEILLISKRNAGR